jgi:peroxiredoxin
VKLDIGSKAPDFSLESADGKKVSLSDFKGK